MTNKEFFKLQLSKIEEVENLVDATIEKSKLQSTHAYNQSKIMVDGFKAKLNAVKQRNNVFKSVLQSDSTAAKVKNFKSSIY